MVDGNRVSALGNLEPHGVPTARTGIILLQPRPQVPYLDPYNIVLSGIKANAAVEDFNT